MARFIQNPNPYSKTLTRRFNRSAFVLVAILGGMALAYQVSQNTNIFTALLAYVVLIICLILSYKIYLQHGKNDRGENAEKEVKQLLTQLADTYTVFENVLIKNNWDIDFVVVGPNNIFAIEVKSHKGINYFSRQKFIKQVFAESMLLKEYLKLGGLKTYIYPVLVFTRAQIKYEAPSKGVCITSADYLLANITQSKAFSFDKIKAEALINNLYPGNHKGEL